MQKRVSWQKGMRLTDHVLRASDECMARLVDRALALASAGRFGLLPSARPFSLSLSVDKGSVGVEAFDCLAITRSGSLIDVQFDTRYTDAFNARVRMPDSTEDSEYLLVVSIREGQWVSTHDGFEVPSCTFALIPSGAPIADDAVPVGRVVDDYGWRQDDVDFVPPCVYVSAHERYMHLLMDFLALVTEMEAKAPACSGARDAMRVFWPVLQTVRIAVDKGRDTLTPMQLLGYVQQCVGTFACACALDDGLTLADADAFMSFAQLPYDYQDGYVRIKEGVGLCVAVCEKMDRLHDMGGVMSRPGRVGAPVIADDQLYQNCRGSRIGIPVGGIVSGAEVLYSVDGDHPSKKLPATGVLSIKNGFGKAKVPEPDRQVMVRLQAVCDGTASDVSCFTVTLHKDYKSWDGYEI